MRRHIAGAARIGVVAPGPADVVGRLEYHEVAPAGLPETDGRPQAAEPGTDHRDIDGRLAVDVDAVLDAGGITCLHAPLPRGYLSVTQDVSSRDGASGTLRRPVRTPAEPSG